MLRTDRHRLLWAVGAVLFLLAGAAAGWAGEESSRPTLPAQWLSRWQRPPLEDRPLQIIHGIPAGRATVEGMQFYKDLGLGGVVCNVAFDHYLRSEENWKTLTAGVEACAKLGMVVWLYDEEGYPSGAAGGLVLAENPAFEASVLALDASRDDPFLIRPAYEHTHASNNFHAARRYPNLLDDRATRSFIVQTHEAYWQRLEPYFGRTIQATFTDEPSLMAVNLGQLPEDVRKKVRVIDPLDPAVKPLPTVPWSYDLAEQYRRRYGEDLMPRRRSLFSGDTDEDRKVRRQFWALVSDLVADRYFGAIGRWCAAHRIASSGHCLWEEELIHHVPLEGNGLKALGLMDIPGLDMLSSDPEVVLHGGWLAAAMPASAAVLHGRRRVMTEISDFVQKMGGKGPVGLAEMQVAAAWQAAWGVTDFTLYYGIADRPAEDYRAYCQYVGRLNAVLKPARLDPQVLLYYPIYDLWAEYRPVAEPLNVRSQSPRARQIVGSFLELGRLLQANQIFFTLIDHEGLAAAKVQPDGKLAIHQQRYAALVLPEQTELPPTAAEVAKQFAQQGGRVVTAPGTSGEKRDRLLIESLKPSCTLLPASGQIVLGQFVRDGRRILLAVNVSREPYDGRLAADAPGPWQIMDPATGKTRPAETDADGRVRLGLAPRQAVIVVQSL